MRNIYDPQNDKCRDYRRIEIHPDVWKQLERARRERCSYPQARFIDNVISLQNKRSIDIAIKYIGYSYLGEYSYMDVFGENVLKAESESQHYKQSDDLQEEINALKSDVANLSEQLSDMQMMIMNMAKMLNNNNKYQRVIA